MRAFPKYAATSIAVVCYKRGNEKKNLSPTPDNAMQTYWGMHSLEGNILFKQFSLV